MTDYLINFSPGESIKASDANSNNQYLLDKLSDNAQSLRTYLEAQIGILQSNISSVQKTLQNNLDNLTEKVTELEEDMPEISKGQKGYIKFSNGFIIQWGRVTGMGNGTAINVVLPTPFTSVNYSVGGSDDYAQTNGDKRSTWRIINPTTTGFTIQSYFEQSGGHVIYWIAVGY